MRTGYGIYEKPLLRIARSWGYDATSGNMTDGRNITPRTRLIEHLDALKTEKRIILW